MHAECPQLDAVPVDRFHKGRLARLLIDGPDGDVVFATAEHFLPLEINNARVAVGLVNEAAVGMDVDRAGALARTHVPRIEQARLHDPWRRREPAVRLEIVEVDLVLPLDGHVNPRLGWMEIEVARSKAKTGT